MKFLAFVHCPSTRCLLTPVILVTFLGWPALLDEPAHLGRQVLVLRRLRGGHLARLLRHVHEDHQEDLTALPH